MIRIELTSFKEHSKLTGKKSNTLHEYAGFLPLMELDTAHYRIPRKFSVENWISEVPESFHLVVKVYQRTSGQGDWKSYYQIEEEMIVHFLNAMSPMVDAGKMPCFSIQFPLSFKCMKENAQYLRKLRKWFEGYSVPIELRDYSWCNDEFLERTRDFMSRAAFSLAVIDEPQLLSIVISFNPFVTNPNFALFRFRGRNAQG